jgi:hypothetical protein
MASCCHAASADDAVAAFEKNEQVQVVQDYYGKELQGTEDLKVRVVLVLSWYWYCRGIGIVVVLVLSRYSLVC